jgi:hypothetical protein
MSAWLRLLGVFATVIVAAFLLKVLPPAVVALLFLGGLGYVYVTLRGRVRSDRAAGAAVILGLRSETGDPFGLLGYPLALFGRAGDPAVENVRWGTWQQIPLKVFDLTFVPHEPVPDRERRRFACAIAPSGMDAPQVIVEPEDFLTRIGKAAELDVVAVGSERFDRAFVVRSGDGSFATTLVGAEMADWLLSLGEGWGFELNGTLAMVYGPQTGRAEVTTIIEVIQGLLARVPDELRVHEEASVPAGPAGLPPPPDVPSA